MPHGQKGFTCQECGSKIPKNSHKCRKCGSEDIDMSELAKFADFLDKDLGITLNKTGTDRNLGESDITTGDTEEERKEADKKKAATQLVEGLSKKAQPEE